MLHFKDAWEGLKIRKPSGQPVVIVLVITIYCAAALVIGLFSGVLNPGFSNYHNVWLLPFTMLVFPSFLEELFFRGLLLPLDLRQRKPSQQVLFLLGSSLVFVLWHPLNAGLWNTTAQVYFFNPFFLLIVALLGLSCGFLYVYTRSLWVAVLVHWFTILAWVFLFGGHNMLGAT